VSGTTKCRCRLAVDTKIDNYVATRDMSATYPAKQIDVSWEIYVKNSVGEIIHKMSLKDAFNGLGHSCGSILKKSDLKGETTLVFEIHIRPTPKYCNYSKYAQPQNTFSENMLNIFLDEDSADIAFKVKGHNIYAHKAILKAQAPDLAELCDGCDETNQMPINDVEPEIFQLMLKTLYGSKLTPVDWHENSESILRAAGKYGFSSLECEAEYWYVKQTDRFTVDNVIGHLLKADSNNLTHLKEAAMEFILNHAEDVVCSDSYDNLDESPTLRKEVMVALSKKVSGDKRKREEEDEEEESQSEDED
jgi:hypothetical protein